METQLLYNKLILKTEVTFLKLSAKAAVSTDGRGVGVGWGGEWRQARRGEGTWGNLVLHGQLQKRAVDFQCIHDHWLT